MQGGRTVLCGQKTTTWRDKAKGVVKRQELGWNDSTTMGTSGSITPCPIWGLWFLPPSHTTCTVLLSRSPPSGKRELLRSLSSSLGQPTHRRMKGVRARQPAHPVPVAVRLQADAAVRQRRRRRPGEPPLLVDLGVLLGGGGGGAAAAATAVTFGAVHADLHHCRRRRCGLGSRLSKNKKRKGCWHKTEEGLKQRLHKKEVRIGGGNRHAAGSFIGYFFHFRLSVDPTFWSHPRSTRRYPPRKKKHRCHRFRRERTATRKSTRAPPSPPGPAPPPPKSP